MRTLVLFLFTAALGLHAIAQTKPQVYMHDPGISPDGRTLAFVAGGDIWTVPVTGGKARLLVSHQAFESRPLFSPDGSMLAFVSTRTGNGDIYTLNLATNQIRQVTFSDLPDELSGWSGDGRYLYFSSIDGEISATRDVYRVAAAGGTPVGISNQRFVSEFHASASPDGSQLLMAAKGYAVAQWWRNGHSHLDETELWLKNISNGQYSRLQPEGARQTWPLWASDGKSFYFVSDRDGHENIYEQRVGEQARMLTHFSSGRVLWPSMAKNGVMAFERDFGIWIDDLKTGNATPVNIQLEGVASGNELEPMELKTISDYAISPDSKKVAFTARGHVFATSVTDPISAIRLSSGPALESAPIWLKGSNEIVFLRNTTEGNHLFKYDFRSGNLSDISKEAGVHARPTLSHDGKWLAYSVGNDELKLMELSTGKTSTLAKGSLGRAVDALPIAWSPDDKMIAFFSFGEKALANVSVVEIANGTQHQVSFLGNSIGSVIQWAGDSRTLFFLTGQRTDYTAIAQVNLSIETPVYREDKFTSLFDPLNPQPVKEQTSPALDSGARNPIVWKGIQDRISLLPLPGDVSEFTVNPKGDELLFSINSGGQSSLYQYSLDRSADDYHRPKLLISAPVPRSDLSYAADGKTIYYQERGVLQSLPLATKLPKPVALTAEMTVDTRAERLETFNLIWQYQDQYFYDPAFHGANWKSIHDKYEPYVMGATGGDEFRRLMNLMVGELNASHSGVSSSQPLTFREGKPGLATGAFQEGKGLSVTEVYRNGPADIAGIKTGDYIVAVDQVKLNALSNLQQLFQNKAGKKLQLEIGSGAGTRMVSIKPVTPSDEKQLIYRQWVSDNRERVRKLSGGRFGYVHIPDMSEESLRAFYNEINAENLNSDGVVVDVRNNSGGFVNSYVLDVLSRKAYLSLTVRGLPKAPARTQLGQRALGLPTILLTNQVSLSDAEDFTEGYRALGLGKVVGEPTAGWIVYTSNITLYDGTVMRLPFIKVEDHEGKDMELHPRPVDIEVLNDPGSGTDKQLETAVNTLLTDLKKK